MAKEKSEPKKEEIRPDDPTGTVKGTKPFPMRPPKGPNLEKPDPNIDDLEKL